MSRAPGFNARDKVLWDLEEVLYRALETHRQGPSEYQGVKLYDFALYCINILSRNPFSKVKTYATLANLKETYEQFTGNFSNCITMIVIDSIKSQILHPSPDKPSFLTVLRDYASAIAKIRDDKRIVNKEEAADKVEQPKLYLSENFLLCTMCSQPSSRQCPISSTQLLLP
jgi:hypothetical protein